MSDTADSSGGGFSGIPICEATGTGKCTYISRSGVDELSPASNCQSIGSGTPVDCLTGGSFASPWKSIEKAAYCVQPGDVVYIRSGTYGPSCTTYPNGATYSYYSLKTGTPTQPITIKAYPGESVILTGGVQFNTPQPGIAGDYHVIQDLELTTAPLIVWASHATIRNNHIHDIDIPCPNNAGGIIVENGATDILIDNNNIHDIFDHILYTTYLDAVNAPIFFANCSGIKLMQDTSDVTIRNNTISNEPAGIHLKYEGEGSNITIKGNTIFDTGIAVYGSYSNWALLDNVIYNSAKYAVQLGGCNAGLCGGYNVTIAQNTFFANPYSVGILSGNPTIHHNIFADSTSIYQTAIYDGVNGGGEGYPNKDLSALSLHDNCYDTGNASGVDPDPGSCAPYTPESIYRYGHDGCGANGFPNIIYDLPAVKATFSQEQNSVFGDPLFVYPQNHDFRLRSGSPCSAMGAYPVTPTGTVNSLK